MSLPKVLVVNKAFPAAGLQLLKQKTTTTVIPCYEYEPDYYSKVKNIVPQGFDAIIWNTKYRLTDEILGSAGPQIKAITTMASGYDQIDVDAVLKRNIPLGNTPKVLDDAVADLAVGIMIAAARRFKEGVQELETGQWKYGVQWMLGQDINNSTVGIIGLGGVGQAIVRRLKGFGVTRFIYSGRSDKPEAESLQAERVPLEQLLKESDFVHICCPLSNETKHLINKDTLNIMKKNAVLVNIARGGIVDQDALYHALKENKIFAAALDVTTPEPLPKENPIVSLPNCYIIPHLGSATFETRNAMAKISAQNILLGLEGKPMLYPVS
ncbi:glyoxylate reductase/hydroxypyruvate reductase-like [Aricia agestis]|uniref:glyoxylate reductase/hydroxypyruvate reductase-like n=1 Tax=Aricia agestis TaxID=91739 RepID=UPI001C202941|nr:glyoxylate reductase/hydroxypyruvate reductase-like [Aricia agestis]